MKCPFCSHDDTQVRDSRPTEDGGAIRRRRQCNSCGARFTTFERVQMRELLVIKKDGTREQLEREKIVRSMRTALRKRNIDQQKIEMVANEIVRRLESVGEQEVPVASIGECVMEELQKLDQVAYIRFASVYRDFSEATDFLDFVARDLSAKEN